MRKKGVASMLVASALLAGGSYAQASPVTITSAITATPIPISAPIATDIDVVAKEIHEKTDLIEIKMHIPQIVGLSDAHFQEEFNLLRVQHAEQSIAEAKQAVEQMAAEAEANGWPIRPGVLQMDFDLKAAGSILSFTVTEYAYLGGANGITTVTTYNINTVQNRLMTLGELFKDGADYQSVINAKIAAEIQARLAANPHTYFEGEMGFQGISADQGFYLEDDQLVIVFPKYSIAPGSTGVPEFSIPMTDLKDLLKDDIQQPAPAPVVEEEEMKVFLIPDDTGATVPMVDPQDPQPDDMQQPILVPLDDQEEANVFLIPDDTGVTVPMVDPQDPQPDDMQQPILVPIVEVTVSPFITAEGVTMIPLRAVCEGLGYQVHWIEEQQMVEIMRGAQWTRVIIGQDDYSFARMQIRLGTAPILKDARTYVPVSFAEQVLKATVQAHDGMLTIRQ